MHRFLTLVLAVSLGGSAVAGQLPAGDFDDDPTGRPPRREAEREKPARLGAPEEGIPPLFRELCPYRTRRIEESSGRHRGHRRTIQRIHRMVRELDELKRTDFEEFELRTRMLKAEDSIAKLADRLRSAGNEQERSRLSRELKEMVSDLFDQKEAAQRSRIVQLEKQMERLKERLAQRRKNRDRIIEERLKELKEREDLRF